ncbi:DctP family TRAP transporter solute-binding subunit [Altererythrobacter aurantiacus]|uniref:DctP family TRAP transporter solute-binding subunit n=1 Tax=Parapontixanthobacter aurantiacus TaxID=1463599 RepID=A0A844ZFD4_9SPHN|nr:TRAP transporter substrate-binding protein [Parapontixanthobacter aurantiacus]MXO84459.1 DctP family TRAP transporter solute-binding subunit [Parapontixanthobacter aurantiacus]
MKTKSLLSRRAFLSASAALGAASLLPGCEPVMSGLLTGADAHPGDYPTVRAVEFMGEYLAQQTGGRLGIKVFAGGQLGSETDTLEITSFGGIDFNRVNFAPLNSVEPMTIPFSLPFVFDSVGHMRRVVDSEVGDEVLAAMEPHDLIGLAIYDSGARNFYNAQRAIRTPADMEGLKIRVPASDLYIAMVNALGANAVPIPFGEIYQSLAQGVIDGAENNWPTFVGERHYEVADYLSLTEHLLTPEMLVMSKSSYEGLSPEDRLLVREAAKASVVEMRRLWDQRVAEARQAVASSSVLVNEVDKTPFAALMRPVWDQFIETPAQQSIVRRILAMGESA